MGYVGNKADSNYSSIDKQIITGNGGTSYTLSHAVANANEIEVFVNNVRQNPGVAYTVNNAALAMTGAVANTDSFYVVFIGKAVQTKVPTDGSVGTAKIADGAVTAAKLASGIAISASTGTFTGNLASTSSGVITNSLITSSTNQYAEQLFQDGNAGYALQVRSDNAQSTGTGSFILNDRDTGSFPVVIKEGNASNTLVLSGSKVGIGTPSPDHALVVRRTDGNQKVLELSTGDSTATMNFSRDGNPTAFIKILEDGSSGTGALVFGTGSSASPAERMRIASGGTLEFNSQGASQITLRSTASGSHIYTAFSFRNSSSSDVGNIAVGTSSTAYNTSSDYRLKENVDYTWDATTRLKQLKPARFNFISDETDNLVDGFIAHEVSSIVPEAITGTKDAMTAQVLYAEGDELPDGKSVGDVKEPSVIKPQCIDQSKLVPLLVKTIQELEARITALEAE